MTARTVRFERRERRRTFTVTARATFHPVAIDLENEAAWQALLRQLTKREHHAAASA